MKVSIERDEIIAAVAAALTVKFGGVWHSETSDYNWPREAEFAEETPEYLARKAEEEAELERMRARPRAQDEADRDAKPNAGTQS